MSSPYDKDVNIDIAHFDKEWLRQADLVLDYGIMMAEAKKKLDRSKEHMDIEEAKAQFRVREKYQGVKPPTVDQVKAETLLDEKYTTARDKFAEANFHLGLVRAAYDAIVTKKSTMENYLKGQLAGFWGQPIEPSRERMEKDNDARREAANKAAAEAGRKYMRNRGGETE